ncbi:hypothetical protein PCASD_06183 [Puccinia coronata f. sp. avenae]|uniref:Integrase catalytic domain-containing protein n=1 Tax=Puccinia coronata f. sp. avenae TaxID=200324 RepID=A0A2N5TGH8_9BASI|nr:hypothetical protein PCASD_06183 [Puccinia coronata f. sp. avenae]
MVSTPAPDDPSKFDARAFLADVDENNWPDALDFFAVTAHKCWHCGGENHYARDCPNKSQLQSKSKAIGTIVGTIYGQLPSGFQVTSSSQTESAYDTCAGRSKCHKHAQQLKPSLDSLPNNTQQQARRLADYYRPRHSQHPGGANVQKNQASQSTSRGSVTAQAVEINGLPDDLDDLDFHSMAIGEDLVSNPTIFDTGASHGFTGSKSFLHNFRPLSRPIPVSVATNGAKSFISGVGNLKFMLPNGNIIVLRQVLYCEQAKATLISMAALRKADALVSYYNVADSFVISASDGAPLFACPFEPQRNRWILSYQFLTCDDPYGNGRHLYQFFHTSADVSTPPTVSEPNLPVVPTSLDSLDDVDDVTHANKKSRVPKPATTDVVLSPDELTEFFKQPVTDSPGYKWQAENMSKDEQSLLYFHRLFEHAGLRHIRWIIKNKLGSGLPQQLPAGKIHCPVDSVDGGKYIMTMRDVATGYSFVCVLAHKWEATGHIISIIDKVENFTEKKVKTLCSDNRGEFVSNKLATCLDKKGIIAEQALPYHHYQNGVIEHFNCTVAAMARTILFNSTLPKSFWSCAFIWVAHTLNQIPNKASGKLTPLEAFLHHKPQFGIFRVFGSVGYAHIPQELRKKLDERATRGHVVAYLGVSKGWRLWVPDENRFIESAMVLFPEELKAVPKALSTPVPPVTQFPSVPGSAPTPPVAPVPPPVPVVTPPPDKMSLRHVMNLMKLGNFDHELEFHNQELIMDKILELCHLYSISVPHTFKQAMKSPEKDEWMKAIAIELNNLEEMRVWSLGQLPSGKKELNGLWVFATKPDEGAGIRFKACFVAKGFTQVAGVDFNATFAPTATFASLRLLLTVAAANDWPVHSFDFVAAYLNSPIDEEVWVKPPEGMQVPAGHALRLEKALYGTRQAARCWHPDLHGVIWLHVDDGVVTASDPALLQRLERDLKDLLKIKWSDELTSIVGLNVIRTTDGFQLFQKNLIDSLLEQHWNTGLTANTPLPPNYSATTDADGNPEESG